MSTLALLLAAAALAALVDAATRLYAAPVAVLSGILLQLAGAPLDLDLLQETSLLAFTFLVFSVGAEIDERHVARHWREVASLSILQVGVVIAVGAALSFALGLPPLRSLYLVLALGAGSTFLVIHLLQQRGRFFERTGRLVTGVSLAQDLLVIVCLALLSVAGEGPLELLRSAALLAVLGICSRVCRLWLAPLVLLRMNLDEEERLLFVLAVLFLFVGAADLAGLPLVTGAFFAGGALSRFPVSGLVRGYVKSLSDFFVLIAFAALGALVPLPRPEELLTELVFIVAFVLVRPLLLMPLVRRTGLSVRASFETLTLLAHTGELGLVVALVGIERGHLGAGVLGMVTGVVVVTMALTPWLSSDATTWRLTRHYPFRAAAPIGAPPRGHIVLLGCGEGGQALLAKLSPEQRERLVIVDDDPGVVKALERQGLRVLRGDGADPEILALAGASQAAAVISTLRRPDDIVELHQHVRGPRVLVRVFSAEEGRRVEELGGRPVIEANIAADAFLRALDERFPSPERKRLPPAGGPPN